MTMVVVARVIKGNYLLEQRKEIRFQNQIVLEIPTPVLTSCEFYTIF